MMGGQPAKSGPARVRFLIAILPYLDHGCQSAGARLQSPEGQTLDCQMTEDDVLLGIAGSAI